MGRYVALGSSFASGPGLPHGTAYPHLVATALGHDLVDVTRSGATTAHVLHEHQGTQPPQVLALDGSEDLVTITIAGNDIGMSAATMTAALPRVVRRLPVVRDRVARTLDPRSRLVALDRVGEALLHVARTVRERSPYADVVLVDYLTVLPPAGQGAPPLDPLHADLVRVLADGLAHATADAAAATGCLLVGARAASADHHAWSEAPWTTGSSAPLPRQPMAFHPNVEGMRATADLVIGALA